MPVSKNKRKSRRGRRRKENLAKALSAFEGGGSPNRFDRPSQPTQVTTPPGTEAQEQTPEETFGAR